MNNALWMLAGLLALIFFASGVQKLTQPRDKLAASGFHFVEDFSTGAVKAIAVLEILAAAGLILPAAFDVLPILVPVAAVGLVLLMIGAAIVHMRRGETTGVVATMAFLTLAAVVAVGRFGPESFAA